jgi:stearoyl-CoA desaturase (delta-9 desaturase)
MPFWAAGVVNGLGHWWGYRNFETADTATNLTPWGVWIGGEELHNNHHAFPSSAKFALRRLGVRHRLGRDQAAGVPRHGQGAARGAQLDVRPNIAMPDTETAEGAAGSASLPGDDRLPAQAC